MLPKRLSVSRSFTVDQSVGMTLIRSVETVPSALLLLDRYSSSRIVFIPRARCDELITDSGPNESLREFHASLRASTSNGTTVTDPVQGARAISLLWYGTVLTSEKSSTLIAKGSIENSDEQALWDRVRQPGLSFGWTIVRKATPCPPIGYCLGSRS